MLAGLSVLPMSFFTSKKHGPAHAVVPKQKHISGWIPGCITKNSFRHFAHHSLNFTVVKKWEILVDIRPKLPLMHSGFKMEQHKMEAKVPNDHQSDSPRIRIGL